MTYRPRRASTLGTILALHHVDTTPCAYRAGLDLGQLYAEDPDQLEDCDLAGHAERCREEARAWAAVEAARSSDPRYPWRTRARPYRAFNLGIARAIRTCTHTTPREA